MKYIDTINRVEWVINPITKIPPPVGVMEALDTHPFFIGFDDNANYLQWVENELPVLVAYTQEELTAKNNELLEISFKENRTHLLASATITVNGFVYEANETSRGRMISAIEAATFLGSPVIPYWRMADNTEATNIPLSDFRNAHAQIMLYMSTIWSPN